MPARGPLTCDQLEKRHNNGRTERGRNRSLSSAIRKGCAWAASKPPPNPCEPKPRAFVTKAKDREVAFMVSGGDCPPGVRADPTEADKQRIKDAAAGCTGTRPSSSFKQCVVDALKAMAEPKRAPKAAPAPVEPPPAVLAPPAFTVQQLPPHLAQLIQTKQQPPKVKVFPAPPPMAPPTAARRLAGGGRDMPPLLPPPPPAPKDAARKIPPYFNQIYVDAVDSMLAKDWPLRVPLAEFGDADLWEYVRANEAAMPVTKEGDELFWNHVRRTYPTIPICDRVRFRRNATMGYGTEKPEVRRAWAERIVREFGDT